MRYPVLILLGAAIAVAPAAAQKKRPATPAKKAPAKKAPAKKPSTAAKKPAPGPDLPSKLPLSAPFCVVNGVKVPLSAYVDALSLRYGPDIREQLVAEALLRQEAKRRGITATAAEVQAAVDRAYQKTVSDKGDEKALAADLKATRGWTLSDFRAVIRAQADLQVLQEKLGQSLVKPTDIKAEEIQKEYDSRTELFTQPDAVWISHILVRRPADDEPNREDKDRQARILAEEYLKRIKGGAAFEQVAKEGSQDNATGPKGGKVPTGIVRGKNPFGAAFEAVVYNSPVGLVNQVIPTPMGYHVIRVDQKKEERTLPLAEVKDQIVGALLAQHRARALDELFVQLRTKAQIETGKF